MAATGGTSGSKPKGRTRRRVELFTFPEQLPGPARFGEGAMESVADQVTRYFRDINAAADDWFEFCSQFGDVFILVPIFEVDVGEDEFRSIVPQHYMLEDTSGRHPWGCILSDKIRGFSTAMEHLGKYKTFGRSWEIDTKLLKEWSQEIEKCHSSEPYSEDLVDLTSRVWRAYWRFCEEVQCHNAIAALNTSEGVAVKPSEPEVGPSLNGGFRVTPADPEPPIDRPDPTRMILILGGHEFGPFTPTQFDVVQVMWENRESAWSESNAFFTFHQKWNWSQADGGPFGRHQTSIQSIFERKGFGLPWKRSRGAFAWCGLIPPKAKRTPKPKVSRSKKR
jgi:hypothetical protein